MENKEIIRRYIETVWNRQLLDEIDTFISHDYHDHSLLPGMPANKAGLRRWIENTSNAFHHNTKIESMVAEDDEVAVRISFGVKHIGKWRGIPPTSREVIVKGFRFFKLKNSRIVAHWALIDGEGLQNALTEEYKGCQLPG